MSADRVLQRGEGGEALTKKSVREAAIAVSRESPLKMALAEDGESLQVRLRLPADDEACAAVAVRFAKNGRSLSGTARGRGEVLLDWCFRALATQLNGEVRDPQAEGRGPRPAPPELAQKARRIVEDHEAEVIAERAEEEEAPPDEDDEEGDATVLGLVAMMVAEGTLALAREAPVEELAGLDSLMEDPSALYEAILEADEVDEVFVSESEFVDVVRRFRLKAAAP